MKLFWVIFLFSVAAASAQSFNFRISGGVADMSETPQGASLFYTLGLGYVSAYNIGVTLRGRRTYFVNVPPQDNYDAFMSYKLIDGDVYDLVPLAGASYIRSPFYLTGNNRSDIDDYFSPVIGINNLIAVGEIVDLNISVEATTAKVFTTYVGVGVIVNLVFQTESRTKRFF